MASSPSSPRTLASACESPSPPEAMPPHSRSQGRDVHIYDRKDSTEIGGLILRPGVTNANFYAMIEIIVIFQSSFFLQDENETRIEKDDQPLQPGKYYIVASQPFHLNNEQVVARTITQSTGTRTHAFQDAVRLRDRQCIISGQPVPRLGGDYLWRRFEAAHIFPIAKEDLWRDYNYDRWITIPPRWGGSINSVQNGLLLKRDIHALFDAFDISINPDDNYKVVAFTLVEDDFEGKYLDRELFTRPDAPIDQLLRWHFRQAVLTNMRGAGEPIFEDDFPPGSDIVGQILRGPKAGERMEFELFNRLGAQMELFPTAGEGQ
ncbi:hypothetical protein AYL99_02961 [Fonsecaea erecta]|uniref:Uncharacterized protein n=1 Tax=Fonsecaea erecta TaxID=1367422 RepID=A0A178ZVB8_9EURO|nr:hypothetical protein AYL99_02961 [Fonsecaea erecta]OAP63734.1 hypothetical protein AYL99_02961 [Fonsecaea erecta]